MTFSIAAADDGAWGVAVASRFLAAGALVPWARAGAGAIATQAFANVSFGPRGLDLLADGGSAPAVLAELLDSDAQREHRQVGIVDAAGHAATFTGSECLEWAGGVSGPGFCAQGNILAGSAVVERMASDLESSSGDLAGRLVAALTAGDDAGGDRRGRQSAAVLVVSPAGGYGGTTDVVVDLRVDDHEHPVRELARLLSLHHLYFDEPRHEDLVPLDDALTAEIGERLRVPAGADVRAALARWAGQENLEERLSEGPFVDRHVLERLRTGGAPR